MHIIYDLKSLLQKKGIYVYIELIHFAEEQQITLHCKKLDFNKKLKSVIKSAGLLKIYIWRRG